MRMKRLVTVKPSLSAILALTGISFAPTVVPPLAQEAKALDAVNQKSAEDLLAEIRTIKTPAWNPSGGASEAKQAEFIAKIAEANRLRGAKILEFARTYPKHAQTPFLLQRRWQEMMPTSFPLDPTLVDVVLADIEKVCTELPGREIVRAGRYTKAVIKTQLADGNPEKTLEAAEEFVNSYPEDERGASLFELASRAEADPAKKKAILERIAQGYPTLPAAAYATGTLRQIDRIGKPFDFEFTDFITKKVVKSSTLVGKVVVVDFWATWAPATVTERATLQTLYTKYKAKGLAIVSISLDLSETEGGKAALQTYLSRNPLPWPQRYLGKGLASPWSAKWGVSSIPTKFILDRMGKLKVVTTGPDLEKLLIPMLGK